MKFVSVKKPDSRLCFYLAASEIVEIDAQLEEVVTRSGRRLKLASYESAAPLISGGILRGVAVADGAIVAVPVHVVDHVIDRWDEGANEWVSEGVTTGGFRFLLDVLAREALQMESEMFTVEELRQHAARMRGEAAADAVAEAAVVEAETAAGRHNSDNYTVRLCK